MTRALIVHSGNMWGGLERVLETVASLAPSQPALDLRFALCFDGLVADRLRDVGARVDILGPARLSRPDLVLRARRQLGRLMRQVSPDVVVVTSAWSNALFSPVARRHGRPCVYWLHDVPSTTSWLDRVSARQVPDLLVCNSRFTADVAHALFPGAPNLVAYYPLLFKVPGRARTDVRAELGTASDDAVILNVARMDAYKGQETLIDALASVPASVRWQCWLAGGAQRPEEARYLDSLRQRVSGLKLQDRVRFLGHRSDVEDLLGAADVYCHPNRTPEAFGIAVVEALHAGLPVVATEPGGPAELVTPDCGRLVPAENPVLLGLALTDLLERPHTRRTLGAAGPARALALCEPAAQLTAFAQALARVASARAAA